MLEAQFAVIVYWMARGALEGVRESFYNKLFDYHLVRFIESISVFIIFYMLIKDVYVALSIWFLGVFLYHRFYVFSRGLMLKWDSLLFHPGGVYRILGLEIPYMWWQRVIYEYLFLIMSTIIMGMK